MNDFNKIFNQIAYRHDFMKVFDDFLTLTICALSMGRMETLYLDTIKEYSKEEISLFGNLLGALIIEYEKRASIEGAWYEGLGDFFMENTSKFGQDARGQFFTPDTICNFMAMVTAGEDGLSERQIIDPACGSGRMLIAFDRTDVKNRFENFYVACDIDNRCVKMCAINMFLYGLKGVVIHMDSLSQKIWMGYRVFLADSGIGIIPLDKHECIPYLYKSRTDKEKSEEFQLTQEIKISEHKNEKAIQLTLF